jgi:hypothetical protein
MFDRLHRLPLSLSAVLRLDVNSKCALIGFMIGVLSNKLLHFYFKWYIKRFLTVNKWFKTGSSHKYNTKQMTAVCFVRYGAQ